MGCSSVDSEAECGRLSLERAQDMSLGLWKGTVDSRMETTEQSPVHSFISSSSCQSSPRQGTKGTVPSTGHTEKLLRSSFQGHREGRGSRRSPR